MKAMQFKEAGFCGVTLRCSDSRPDSYYKTPAVVIDLGDKNMKNEWVIHANKKQTQKLRDWLIQWCKENS